MNELDRKTGQALSAIRKARGVTIKEICEKSDLYQSKVSCIENGKTSAKIADMEAYIEVCNATIKIEVTTGEVNIEYYLND